MVESEVEQWLNLVFQRLREVPDPYKNGVKDQAWDLMRFSNPYWLLVALDGIASILDIPKLGPKIENLKRRQIQKICYDIGLKIIKYLKEELGFYV